MKLTIYSIFINFLFINLTLGHPPNVDSNLREFKVKIQKNWTQQKEYEYLFNAESIGQAMALTVYQAKIVPKEPRNWQLEMDGNESVLYEFSIPNHWARSELELRIELAQSEQVKNVINK
jgi:hypothetical protein